MAASATAGVAALELSNVQGDRVATTSASPGSATTTSVGQSDEFGIPPAGAAPARYGWLGTHQRSNDALGDLTLMGARLYLPVAGTFLSVDAIRGGNATAYSYPQDPINFLDLDGFSSTYRYGKWVYRYTIEGKPGGWKIICCFKKVSPYKYYIRWKEVWKFYRRWIYYSSSGERIGEQWRENRYLYQQGRQCMKKFGIGTCYNEHWVDLGLQDRTYTTYLYGTVLTPR